MKYKYKTSNYNNKIEKLECVSETASFVTVKSEWCGRANERRMKKTSAYDRIHDTWREAHDYLIKHCEEQVLFARRALELANSTLGNVKGMKEPE